MKHWNSLGVRVRDWNFLGVKPLLLIEFFTGEEIFHGILGGGW